MSKTRLCKSASSLSFMSLKCVGTFFFAVLDALAVAVADVAAAVIIRNTTSSSIGQAGKQLTFFLLASRLMNWIRFSIVLSL